MSIPTWPFVRVASIAVTVGSSLATLASVCIVALEDELARACGAPVPFVDLQFFQQNTSLFSSGVVQYGTTGWPDGLVVNCAVVAILPLRATVTNRGVARIIFLYTNNTINIAS